MAVTKFVKNMSIISALDDEPNEVDGLSAAELKAKFDEGGLAIQEYINTVLIPTLETLQKSAIGGVILYNDSQSLSDAEKLTARTNIGAVSSADVTEAINAALGDYATALSSLDDVIGGTTE